MPNTIHCDNPFCQYYKGENTVFDIWHTYRTCIQDHIDFDQNGCCEMFVPNISWYIHAPYLINKYDGLSSFLDDSLPVYRWSHAYKPCYALISRFLTALIRPQNYRDVFNRSEHYFYTDDTSAETCLILQKQCKSPEVGELAIEKISDEKRKLVNAYIQHFYELPVLKSIIDKSSYTGFTGYIGPKGELYNDKQIHNPEDREKFEKEISKDGKENLIWIHNMTGIQIPVFYELYYDNKTQITKEQKLALQHIYAAINEPIMLDYINTLPVIPDTDKTNKKPVKTTKKGN